MPREPGAKRIPGTPPDGWAKTQFYAPEKFVKAWDEAKVSMPGQVHKHMCTAAMAVFVGLPRDIQVLLYKWAHANELNPEAANPEEAALIVAEMIRRVAAKEEPSRPLHAWELEVVENAAKVIGDRSPKREMADAVRAFKLRDYEKEEREAQETRRMIAEGLDNLEAEQRRVATGGSNIKPIGRVKPMPVVPVNGPTGEEITHEVTRILDPDILGKGKKKGAA